MTIPSNLTLLYSPFPDRTSAQEAARLLVTEHLLACVNLSACHSGYLWDGEWTQAEEWVLLGKTTPERAAQAAVRLEELHPYETPCILQWPAQANSAFADWADQSAKSIASPQNIR